MSAIGGGKPQSLVQGRIADQALRLGALGRGVQFRPEAAAHHQDALVGGSQALLGAVDAAGNAA